MSSAIPSINEVARMIGDTQAEAKINTTVEALDKLRKAGQWVLFTPEGEMFVSDKPEFLIRLIKVTLNQQYGHLTSPEGLWVIFCRPVIMKSVQPPCIDQVKKRMHGESKKWHHEVRDAFRELAKLMTSPFNFDGYPTGGYVKVNKEELGFLTNNEHPTDYFPRNLIHKEKPMGITLEQLQSLKPGDRIYYDGIVARSERIFLGIDPMQPPCAMVRCSNDPSAPIQVIHRSNLHIPEKDHVVEMGIWASGLHVNGYVIKDWTDKEKLRKSVNQGFFRKVIDARATEDGLLLVKYSDETLEEDVMMAAHQNPATAFN